MNVHANAKLSPRGRLVMCRRVVEQGWSLRYRAEIERLLDDEPALFGSRRQASRSPPGASSATGVKAGRKCTPLRRLKLHPPPKG